MKVLVACEYSARVRDAFLAKGHDAWSCDLLETEGDPGRHIVGDVMPLLGQGWDLLIAHPPCTYLTRAGSRWWNDPERKIEQQRALDFVRALLSCSIPRKCIENPPGAIGTKIRKADQYIQPWEHGEPEKKMTGLWLENLPLLVPSNDVRAYMLTLPEKLQSKCHYAAPGPDRWKERSRTYIGIAQAMANQWG